MFHSIQKVLGIVMPAIRDGIAGNPDAQLTRFGEIMDERAQSFESVLGRGELSPQGAAFVRKILAPEGFAATARARFEELRAQGASNEEIYRCVYGLIPMWREAGYDQVPAADLLQLGLAEFKGRDLLHPSARYMIAPAADLLVTTMIERARGTFKSRF